MSIKRLTLVVLVSLATAPALMSQQNAQPDPNGKPTFGAIQLKADFQPDPHSVKIIAGGPIKTNLGGVNAYVAQSPDYRLAYTAGQFQLTFMVKSDAKTTLLINLPDGKWVANGDATPIIRVAMPASGQYDIFVGSANEKPATAVLFITEGQVNAAPVAPPQGKGAAEGGERPTVETFKQVLDAQLQKLKPEAHTRTVLFQDVKAGAPNGKTYPFQATAIIHDYHGGFPKNRFYGFTRVGKIEGWKYNMYRDDFGRWVVEGAMTPGFESKNNPAEGVSAFPVSSLPGTPAGKGTAPPQKQPAQPIQPAPAGNLHIGEYAGYGTGGRLLIGIGFHLKEGGVYHDLDGKNAGKYIYDPAAATITFRGGFLDGQVGRDVRINGFQLSPTIRCEPWRRKGTLDQ